MTRGKRKLWVAVGDHSPPPDKSRRCNLSATPRRSWRGLFKLEFGGETKRLRLRIEFGVRFGFRSRFSRSANIGSQVSARDSVLERVPRPREIESQTLAG
ncbi:hypothetical protein AVEN_92797-1 [Araneus ventricosus]|uniref:Uncharacterized protein n=1 Tax=Araneus ventricosus TaxID=182803 RepID=A0A4Y1ZSE4_ARAVE|nr:hypothetical protein AVEN_92797-1 [Araneus ventricosus]